MDGEIRVLELHPAEAKDALRGRLHIVSIDFTHPDRYQPHTRPFDSTVNIDRNFWGFQRHTNHAVSVATGQPVWYTALSYVWGVPVFDQNISFEHGSINITSSLATALHHLRSTEHGIFLWIDQICINQSDLAEKVQQIPLMGLIYTHATNTLIWLGGDDGSDPNLAFDTIETVFARLQGTDAQVLPSDFERLDFPPEMDRAWWTVRQLLRRPWFGRLWTIQEAVLSRNLYLKYGQAEVCWDDFAAWCYCLNDTGLLGWLTAKSELDEKHGGNVHMTSLPPEGATVVNSIQADRIQGLALVQKEYLLNMLVSTRYAQATQPKDKVYGVLGIANSNIIPDYSPDKSARDVYHEACLTQLPQLQYELLSCVDHETPLQPSWVPDWSTPRVTEVLGYSTKAWTLYCTGGRPVTGQYPKFVLSDNKRAITLSGKIFDTISSLGCVSSDPMLNIDDPQARNQELASYVDMARNTHNTDTYPVAHTSVYEAFLHTLVAGRDGSGVSTISPDHSEVFSLLLDSTTGQEPSLPGQTYSPRRQKRRFTLDNLRTRKPAKTLEDLQIAYHSALKMRRFAVTKKGYFALVPRGARRGDEVAVLDRACVPFVVRRSEGLEGGGYELLGEAYVHGIMKGEVMDMQDIQLEDVTLV
jgi:hypothetical protein